MSMITVLKSKIHRAVVTETELDYEGSITIDKNLLDKVNICPYEKVHIYNINNGARFETYVIVGESGKKDICLNGAAARMAQKGDRVIIVSYALIKEEKSHNWKPSIITLNEHNNPL